MTSREQDREKEEEMAGWILELDAAGEAERARAFAEAERLPESEVERRLERLLADQMRRPRRVWMRTAAAAAAVVVIALGVWWSTRRSPGPESSGTVLLSSQDYSRLEVTLESGGQHVLRFELREPLPGEVRYHVRVEDEANGIELDNVALGPRTEWTLTDKCYTTTPRKVVLIVSARSLESRAEPLVGWLEVELPAR